VLLTARQSLPEQPAAVSTQQQEQQEQQEARAVLAGAPAVAVVSSAAGPEDSSSPTRPAPAAAATAAVATAGSATCPAVAPDMDVGQQSHAAAAGFSQADEPAATANGKQQQQISSKSVVIKVGGATCGLSAPVECPWETVCS